MHHMGQALVGNAQFITENYVSSPPAMWIVDSAGTVFELGPKRYVDPNANFRAQYQTDPNGEFAFNVVVNGVDSGEYASRIERRQGRVRIFCRLATRSGWKVWNGHGFI